MLDRVEAEYGPQMDSLEGEDLRDVASEAMRGLTKLYFDNPQRYRVYLLKVLERRARATS